MALVSGSSYMVTLMFAISFFSIFISSTFFLSVHIWILHPSLSNYKNFQVMYSFVMRPESLPKSYQDFIQKTGPVAAPVYKAVRECCRGSPVDVASLAAYLSGRTSNDVKLDMFPGIIPCTVIHPDTKSCLVHNANAAKATFRKTFPLYFSLTFVPFVVLRLQKVLLKLLNDLCMFEYLYH